MIVDATPGKVKPKEVFNSSRETSVIFVKSKSLFSGSILGFVVTSLLSVPHERSNRTNSNKKCVVGLIGKF
jgi:1-acyl-sn-glycerol-3-phosphate acyltransferase